MQRETLGGYRLEGKIASGGMATIYKAYDADADRYVAIKVLPETFADQPIFQARFEREAKAIAQLEHPHIIPVHAFGQDAGIPYIVMRYMPSGSLSDRIRRGPMSGEETVRILRHVASALDYAHRRGVLHRDVKPGNVLLDAEGNAYLTDFGIARILETTTQLTGSGTVLGTPAYMSPEQCMGESDLLTPASDQYSLGIVAYEMLSGELPFNADTPLAILRQQIETPLPSVRALRPELPGGVEHVLVRATAKHLDGRYASCSAFVDALDAALAGRAEQPEPLHTVRESAAVGATLQEETPYAATAEAPRRTGPAPAPAPTRRREGGRGWLWVVGVLMSLFAVGVVAVFALYALGAFDNLLGGGQAEIPTAEVVDRSTDEPADIPTRTPAPAGGVTQQPEVVPPSPEPATAEPTQWVNAQGYPLRETHNGQVQVLIPAGSFNMGGTRHEREQPAHSVTLTRSFWLDVTEVTNAQYAACVSAGACAPPHDPGTFTRSDYYGNPAFSNHPVVWVSWQQAQSYCRWAGGRLPYEAEWEYAARGPQSFEYPWGNAAPSCDLLNYAPDEANNVSCTGDTTAVGSYPRGASPFGVMDLAGNVWEWVADTYTAYSSAPAVDPFYSGAGDKVERGGSWTNEELRIRGAYRFANEDTHANYGLGFRCAADS